MQKIAEYNVQPYGTRGAAVTMPKVFVTDNHIAKGDKIEIYRTDINGKDALVIIPASKPLDSTDKLVKVS